MECMCVQTRPWFILPSERGLLTGVRTHVVSKEKILSTGGSEEDRIHDAASCMPNTLPAELLWSCIVISMHVIKKRRNHRCIHIHAYTHMHILTCTHICSLFPPPSLPIGPHTSTHWHNFMHICENPHYKSTNMPT